MGFPDLCALDLNTTEVQFSSIHSATKLMFSEVVLEMITSLKPGLKLLATYGWRAEKWWK